jgi:hypothetical protein
MTPYLSFDETKLLLERIIKNPKAAKWAVWGLMLESVFKNDIWREEAVNFTDWMKYIEYETGKNICTLWRYKGGWAHYVSSRNKLIDYKIELLDAEELSKVSFEHIELLAKLERVAPEEVIHELYIKVFNGTIRRVDLREKWDIFKVLLGGKTARGKNVEVPKYDPNADKDTFKFLTSKVFNVIKDEFIERIGASDYTPQHIHRFYVNYKIDYEVTPEIVDPVTLRIKIAETKTLTLDALIVVKYNSKKIHLHGIHRTEAKISARKVEHLKNYEKYCDYVWIVCDDIYYANNLIFDEFNSENWGVITETNDLEIEIEKMPLRNKAEDRVNILEKVLLTSL